MSAHKHTMDMSDWKKLEIENYDGFKGLLSMIGDDCDGDDVDLSPKQKLRKQMKMEHLTSLSVEDLRYLRERCKSKTRRVLTRVIDSKYKEMYSNVIKTLNNHDVLYIENV